MKNLLKTFGFVLLLISFSGLNSCIPGQPFYVEGHFPDQSGICLPASSTQAWQVYTFPISKDDVVSALTTAGVTDFSEITSAKILKLQAELESGANFSEVSTIDAYIRPASGSGIGDQIAYSSGDLSSAGSTVVLNCNAIDVNSVVTEDQLLTVRILNVAAGNVNPVCVKLTSGVVQVKVTPTN